MTLKYLKSKKPPKLAGKLRNSFRSANHIHCLGWSQSLLLIIPSRWLSTMHANRTISQRNELWILILMEENESATILFGLLIILFRSDILLGVIWKRFPAMFRMITHLVWVISQYQQTSTWQPISRDTCASRVNKMAIIFMKCMKMILYSLQIKVTVQWKSRIYKPRKSGRLMASSNILKRYWFAALVFQLTFREWQANF